LLCSVFPRLVTVGTSVVRSASQSDGIKSSVRKRLRTWLTALPSSNEDSGVGERAILSMVSVSLGLFRLCFK